MLSVRLNEAGVPAARSPSELYVNVPSVLPPTMLCEVSVRNEPPILMRCPPVPGSHDISSDASKLLDLDCVGRPLLPPKASVVTPTEPSGSCEATCTRPAGTSVNGEPLLLAPWE